MLCGLLWSCWSRSVPSLPGAGEYPLGAALGVPCPPSPGALGQDSLTPGLGRGPGTGFPRPGLLCPSSCSSLWSSLSPIPFPPFGHSLFPQTLVFPPFPPEFPQRCSHVPVPSRVPKGISAGSGGALAAAPPSPWGGTVPEQSSQQLQEGDSCASCGSRSGSCWMQGCAQVRLPHPQESLGLWGLICISEYSEPLQGRDLSSHFSGLFPGLFLM